MQANSSAMLIIHQSTWCHSQNTWIFVTCVTSALQNTDEIHDNRLHYSVHKMEILPKLWNCPHLVFLSQHVTKCESNRKETWVQLDRFLEILNLLM
jgi:DNA mismatch repair ATPase MutL